MEQHETDLRGDGQPALSALEGALERARTTARVLLIVQRATLIVAAALVLGLMVGVLDYLVRTPWMMRAVLLFAGVCVSGWAIVKYIVPAAGFKPTLTEMALRLEGTDTQGRLGLRGNLASALELARTPHLIGAGKEMAVRLARDLAVKTRSLRVLRELLTVRLTFERVGMLALTLLPLTLLWAKAPEVAEIGMKRVLTPWSQAQWPKRYAVADATIRAVHATTEALPLRAVLVRSPRDAGKSDVTVVYRAAGAGKKPGDWQRVLLTSQGRASPEFAASVGGVEGELYERLLEPGVIDAGAALLTDEVGTLEYRIEAGDDVTETREIVLARPPQIAEARVAVVVPAYATNAAKDAEFAFVSGERELSAREGVRGSVGPVLAGSTIELNLEFSKKMPREGAEEFARGALGLSADEAVDVEARERGWTLRWRADEARKFTVQARDEHGLSLSDETTFRFDVAEDTAPTAAMLTPASDEAVLATAVVAIRAEARDDVHLASAMVQQQVHTAVTGSESRELAARGEPVTFAEGEIAAPRQVVMESELDISTLDVQAGNEVWVTATARDGYEAEGATHAAARSGPRKLRIISEAEFIEQLRSDLGTIRQSAVRLDGDQAETAKRTQEAAGQQEAAEAQRRQDAIVERLKPPADALRKLQERFERNRADEAAMESTLQDALDAAQKATQAAQDAAENVKQAAQGASGDAALPAAARERLQEASVQQAEVRKELSRLMDMLGQSQDAWAARRRVEKLLQDQKRVTQEAQQAGSTTAGKAAEELTPWEAAELNRVAQQQRELSQQVQQAVDEMEAGAQANSTSNPAQAQAMKEAAQKGRQAQASEKQKAAAEQLERNQTQTANALQKQAEQALEDMLQSLEQGEKRRDEELRRVLADVRGNVMRLISRQEAELASLATAMRTQQAKGLDGGMIGLHELTLGLQEELAANKELGSVEEIVADAAEAQATAVTALREMPVAFTKADGAERTSLQRLREALAKIDELQQKSEEKDLARAREELRKSYEEMLARQREIRKEIEPLLNAGRDLSRRERQNARDLAATQETLRTDMYTLQEKTEFLAEAKVFEFAHVRLDAAAKGAVEILGAGSATSALARHENSLVRTLEALVESLKDLKKNDDFRDGDSGGGGGGGGPEGGKEKEKTIPPIAELRLLRMMQQEAFEVTRAAADEGDTAAVQAATALQVDLSAQAKSLLERTKEENGGGEGGPPIKINPPPAEPKAPEPKMPEGT